MSTTTAQTQKPEYLGLLAAGYVMAFVLPIGGIVVAMLLADKRTGHAVALMLLSVFCGFMWFVLIARS